MRLPLNTLAVHIEPLPPAVSIARHTPRSPLLALYREMRANARHFISWNGRGLTHTLRCGLRAHISTRSEWNVYNEVFVDGEYDEAIGQVIGPGPTTPLVLDLGAHAGYFALRFADLWQRAHPGRPFHVACVEGSPRMLRQLSRHLAQPGLRSQCTVHFGLVGARSGHARISRSIHTSVNSIVDGPSLTSVSVPFIDLDTVVPARVRIALLKCDVEGAEQLCLDTYPELLTRVDVAVFEFHSQLCDVPRCRALLAFAGLTQRTLVRVFGPTCTIELFERPAGLETDSERERGRR